MITRDEVLQYLTNLADQYDAALGAIEGSGSRLVEVYSERAKAFSAAAELIRAGGWRPIAEAPEDGQFVTYGKWQLRRGSFFWEEYYTPNKQLAIDSRFTHYLSKPEPPAREVPNDRG